MMKMTCCRCSWRGPVQCFHESEDLCPVCVEATEGMSVSPRMRQAAEDFASQGSDWQGLNIDSIHDDDTPELNFD